MDPPSELLAQCDRLVERHRSGDRQAFDALVRLAEPPLRLFVCSRCQRGDDADEVINTAFVTAFEHLPEYEPRGQFLSWLMGIAFNHLRELRRTRWKHQGNPIELALDRLWAEQMGEDPDGRLEALRQHLAACLRDVDERSRSLLERHHVDGESLADLARRYHRPRQAIARLLFAIRSRLRDCIGQRTAGEVAHG
jgi:RNA polymerase sigma-70 factor (ECF subfamily)